MILLMESKKMKNSMKPNTLIALETAIKLAGGQTELANKIEKTQGHISAWIRREKVPPEEARVIDEKLNGQVTRYDLRPDVFGEQPQQTK